LVLYNFGFAESKGTPKISAATISNVVFDVNIYGKNGVETFKGKIVGFSDRISSFLVPDKFMKYSNNQFGNKKTSKTSKLIIKVKDRTDPTLAIYLKNKKYETNKDKLRLSKNGNRAKVLITVFGIFGLFFLVLSLIITTLVYQLIISNSRRDIRLLVQLGYNPNVIAKQLLLLFFYIIIVISTIALSGLVYTTLFLIHPLMAENGFKMPEQVNIIVVAIGVSAMMATLLINIISVRKNIFKQI
jgi:hypothetical protein